jgi:hypothetical protein
MSVQQSASNRGRAGGLATLEKHGQHHFSIIGTAGRQAVLERRWNGDTKAMHAYLSRCRWAARRYDEVLACTVRAAAPA